MYKGKETRSDSRHNDYDGGDFFKTTFIEAHVGKAITKELQKIYKEIIMNGAKIRKDYLFKQILKYISK